MEKTPIIQISQHSSDIEAAGLSAQPAFSRIPRKMVRILLRILTRRAVALALGLTFVSYLFYYGGTDILTREYALNGVECLSNRTNPNFVHPPWAQESKFLSGMWDDFKKLFDEHRPDPSHLDQPKHGGFPNQDNLAGFFNLTNEEADKTRETHKKLLTKLPSYPSGRFTGRGVVILAGARYSEFAATSVGMLRETGSKLPVEVWSKDHGEENDEWCTELKHEGMACRRLADYMNMDDLKHPYQWKVFTLLYSTFEEILFLDADSMPMKNPDFVFDSAIYKEKGVILWPDYWKHTGHPVLPYVIGINNTRSSDMIVPEMSVESGQIYWNKKTHWKSLVLATYYNYFGVDYWFTIFNNGWAGWGDKDTFIMACKATKEPYYHVPHKIVTVFVTGTIDGIGMVQADPTDKTRHRPLFMHSNMIKWSMRELLCSEDCKTAEGQGQHPFHMINDKSKINSHLREGKRIFAVGQLFEGDLDPEPMMWRSVEHTACRSTWGSEHLCKNARDYMDKTFGFKFTKHGKEDKNGMNREVCIEGPWAKPSRAKPKPKNWTKDYKEVYPNS